MLPSPSLTMANFRTDPGETLEHIIYVWIPGLRWNQLVLWDSKSQLVLWDSRSHMEFIACKMNVGLTLSCVYECLFLQRVAPSR